MSYRALLSSDTIEFLQRNGSAVSGLKLEGASRAVPARLLDPPNAAWHLMTRRHGVTVNLPLLRYQRALFPDVYPGIDADYHSSDGDLEIDFRVRPGARPEQISLSATPGSTFVEDRATGDVILVGRAGRYRLRRPTAYQWIRSRKVAVPVVATVGGTRLGFRVGAYDHDRTLTIDPLVAVYSTYIGSNTDAEYDNVSAVAVDAQGDIYLGGLTEFTASDTSFPTTPSSLEPQSPGSGGDCAYQCGFVVKLDANHHVIYGALVFGATVQAIAIDAQQCAYATGTTLDGSSYPATQGAFSNNPVGQAFAFKLNAAGSSFIYSALFVGDGGTGIAADALGNAYVVGNVGGPNLPTTSNAVKPAYQSTGNTINHDGFLLKIDPTGSNLVYGTYLGGSGNDSAAAVMIDASGTATVVGQTASNDFVGLAGSVDGDSDAVVLQVSPDGTAITSGRFIGGSAADQALAVSPDNQGGYVLAGLTESEDFPVTTGAFQSYLLGRSNGWIARLDGSLETEYTTLLGGSFQDGLQAVAADATGNVYVAGFTYSSDMPTSSDGFQSVTSTVSEDQLDGIGPAFYISGTQAVVREGYVAELDSSLETLLYGSYLGGFYSVPRFSTAVYSEAEGLTLGSDGQLYVAGETEAASFPITDGGLRPAMGGQADGFLVQFASSSLSITTPSLLPDAWVGQSYSQQLTAAGGTPPYQWQEVSFELPNGISLQSNGILSGTAANTQTEASGYQFTVKVTDTAGNVAYRNLFVNILYPGVQYCVPNSCVINAEVMQAFAFQIPTLARGLAPFTAYLRGNAPPGITVSPTGDIEGTPTSAGQYQFSIYETDSSSLSANLTVQMNVSASNGSSGSSGGSSGSGNGSSGSGDEGSSSGDQSSTVSSASTGKGGGGAIDLWTLLALGGLACWRAAAFARRRRALAAVGRTPPAGGLRQRGDA